METRQKQWIGQLTGANFDNLPDTDWPSPSWFGNNHSQLGMVTKSEAGYDRTQSRWFDSDGEDRCHVQKDDPGKSRWFDSDDEEEDREQKEDASKIPWLNSHDNILYRNELIDNDRYSLERDRSEKILDDHRKNQSDLYDKFVDVQDERQRRKESSNNLRSDGNELFELQSKNSANKFYQPPRIVDNNLHDNNLHIDRCAAVDETVAQEQAIMARIHVTHQLLLNEFVRNDVGWAVNLLHATTREASITWLATMIRETIGYLSAQNLDGATDFSKVAISSGILALTGILNVLASVRQEAQKKANWTTRAAHASTLILLGGVATVAHQTTGLSNVAPLMIKATGYCLSRDGINLLVRLDNNRESAPNLQSIATEMAVYSVNQYIVNELQSAGLALSGTSEEAQSLPYREIFGRLAAFSAANAAGETFDALVYPALVAFYNDIGSGMHASLKSVKEMRLAAKFHFPMAERLVARFPPAEGIVGGVTGSDVVDSILGPMTARQSVFVILFSMLDLLAKAGAAARFSAEGTKHLVNALAGISIGLLGSVFLGALATSLPRPAPIQPEVV